MLRGSFCSKFHELLRGIEICLPNFKFQARAQYKTFPIFGHEAFDAHHHVNYTARRANIFRHEQPIWAMEHFGMDRIRFSQVCSNHQAVRNWRLSTYRLFRSNHHDPLLSRKNSTQQFETRHQDFSSVNPLPTQARKTTLTSTLTPETGASLASESKSKINHRLNFCSSNLFDFTINKKSRESLACGLDWFYLRMYSFIQFPKLHR